MSPAIEIPGLGLKRQLPQTPLSDYDGFGKRLATEPEVSLSNPESFSITPTTEDLKVMDIDGSGFDPASYESISIPEKKSLIEVPPPNDEVQVKIPVAEKKSTIETRHPLPSPPVTPNLCSSPRFPSNFAPSTPNLGHAPAPTRKTKPRRSLLSPHTKNPNPYIDFRDVTGYTDAQAYWATPPFVHRGVMFNKPGVGPFRKAAMYEFIGQTFENERKRGKKSHHRRHKAYKASCQDSFAQSSKLRIVQTVDSEKEEYNWKADLDVQDVEWPDRWEGWEDFEL